MMSIGNWQRKAPVSGMIPRLNKSVTIHILPIIVRERSQPMKESFVRITTADTKKTYEFPNKDNPPLFEVSLKICPIQANGGACYDVYQYTQINKSVHLELETLLRAGLEPYHHKAKENDPEPTETAEDLIIRLLETVGYYPCPHDEG